MGENWVQLRLGGLLGEDVERSSCVEYSYELGPKLEKRAGDGWLHACP